MTLPSGDFAPELALAHELADRAAEIAVEVFGREFEVRKKADLTPVTEADTGIEAMIRDAIADRFPGDAILGEEQGLEGSGSRVWVVDPIDGTKNFAARIPVWATLVAFSVDGDTKVGLASAPLVGERYAAVRGQGATMNGRPIHVSSTTKVAEALVSVADLRPWLERPDRGAFLRLCAEAERVRGFGDFWGHMLVARGAADAMLESELRTWDYAALQVIVEEAGGVMTQVDRSPLADGGSVLTANPALHETIAARFAQAA
ncbi:MAG TPA: inositol monophosphatase family protein [Actinomycetota bacterium]|nr:inositol monophosphatase family protein [Actinomycetota bacterium]